jgi:dipeptide/tripeptide permease
MVIIYSRVNMNTLDFVLIVSGILLVIAFFYIIWSYVKGLKGSPYEIYLLFFTKVTEYSAYGAINISFILYLSADMGLSDVQAGTFMGTFGVMVTLMVMIVGPVCDAIGIKKTLLFGAYTLLFSRFLMPFMPNIYLSVLFGFFPMAFGLAITGPVLSVGIKRFTTKETAALGFGLFYTLMNIGWAIGAQLFDTMRSIFGETAGATLPFVGLHLSTYQLIILIGFFINIPDLIAILLMRDGVEMTADKGVVVTPTARIGDGGNFINAFTSTVRNTAKDTFTKMKSVFGEKAFWVFIFMLAMTVFVRLVFSHFHYTFPKYGIRILGDGAKIGSIYGVLNPTMVVFLVPLAAALTKKISSYKMMFWGTLISALAVFIAVIPPQYFAFLTDTWVGELIYDRWLGVPLERQTPLYFSLIVFIIVFTIGEALWSPRLMQFTAQIAPIGKEASYLSLAVLPWFAARLIVGPLSGWLVDRYTPAGLPSGIENYPDQHMVWLIVGSMAVLTPIALLIFRKVYITAEARGGVDQVV